MMTWATRLGSRISAPLSFSGPYVISHRRDCHTLSYRPTGVHKHLGQFKTVDEAKEAAETHRELQARLNQEAV